MSVVRCTVWAQEQINKIVRRLRKETGIFYGQKAVVDDAVRALIEKEGKDVVVSKEKR